MIAISIFGSVARGEEQPDSDIDIEIVSTKERKWKLSKKSLKEFLLIWKFALRTSFWKELKSTPSCHTFS